MSHENRTQKHPNENQNIAAEHASQFPNPIRPDWTTRFTGILALFAVLSFIALWIQLIDARNNFRRDQRPYVWPSLMDPRPMEPQKPIYVDVFFVNYGKTPAINQHGAGKVLVFTEGD